MPVVHLQNGTPVHFHLKKRERPGNTDRYYSVCFTVPPKKRIERSTGQTTAGRAEESARAIITREFAQPIAGIGWEAAVNSMVSCQQAENLRPDTIAQYKIAVNLLRKLYHNTDGPCDITPQMAERFKVWRMENDIAPRTIKGNVENLSIVYGRWFRDTCHIVESNPFETVEPPRLDKPKPRVIDKQENRIWHNWLRKQWGNWRLPILFLEVKAELGCRITELASATSDNLKHGRITFLSDATKGRRERSGLLSPALYRELKKVAGETYIFERFAAQLKERHNGGRAVGPYHPKQLKKWLERQLREFREDNPLVKKFKLHNYRATAISKARERGVSPADAAIAFGVDARTAAAHYTALDEITVADKVFKTIHR